MFYEDKFDESFHRMIKPLIDNFNHVFKMNIKTSDSLEPPQFEISKEFVDFVDSLNNWQLIGLETMTIWMKSTISAVSVISITHFIYFRITNRPYLNPKSSIFRINCSNVAIWTSLIKNNGYKQYQSHGIMWRNHLSII